MVTRLQNTIKAVRRSGFNVPGLLIALWFFACATSFLQPKTAVGVQCPTAAVQTVVREVKDKCGCVIGHRVEAPKPGDKAFVQCRCAEKKASTTAASTSPKFELMQVEAPALELPGRILLPAGFQPVQALDPTVSIEPPTLPPGLA